LKDGFWTISAVVGIAVSGMLIQLKIVT